MTRPAITAAANGERLRRPVQVTRSGSRVRRDASRCLHIEHPDLPPRVLSVDWISHVVCAGGVRIDPDALLLCLQAGIPVTHCDRAGRALGHSLPVRLRPAPLGQRLQQAVFTAQWATLWPRWREHQRRAALARAMRDCRLRPSIASELNPDASLQRAHAQRHGRDCGPWLRALAEAQRHALFVAIIDWIGHDLPALAEVSTQLDITAALGDILAAGAHRIAHAHAPPADPAQMATTATRLNLEYDEYWDRLRRQLLIDLERWLGEHWG